MGIKKKPGPYKMSQDHLLPKFAPVRKPGEERIGVPNGHEGPAAVAAALRPETTTTLENAVEAAVEAKLTAPVAQPIAVQDDPAKERKRKGARRFGFRWAGRLARFAGRGSGSSRTGQSSQPDDVELTIERVRVVRNDLSDSDYQVVLAQNGSSSKNPTSNGTNGDGGRRPLGMVWNRLSARLLRQAALDFNAVQKERGKLLSQASNGGGGANGA